MAASREVARTRYAGQEGFLAAQPATLIEKHKFPYLLSAVTRESHVIWLGQGEGLCA